MKSKKKLRDKPTLFLDFDGPVTDVSKRYYLVHREIAFWLGKQYKIKPKLNLESFWDLKRKKETVRGILDKDGYLKISKSDYLKLWLKLIESKEYLKYDRLQANIIKDLGKLKKRFFIVVVSLRRNKIGLKNQIRNLNLRQYFSCILSASPKPSSDKNWLLKQRLIKQSPFYTKDSYIIGDTEIDIKAGKSLGIKTVALLCGIRNKELLKKEKPDYLLNFLSNFTAKVT